MLLCSDSTHSPSATPVTKLYLQFIMESPNSYTVLVLIKLTKFAVALWLPCGCVAVPVN